VRSDGASAYEGHDLNTEGVESLDRAELVGLVRTLVQRVQTLESENERLRSENERLRSEVGELRRDGGRDSTNSGLPPAGDDKAARQKRAEARRKTVRGAKRRPGGQPGGAGHTLSPVPDPDRTVLHRPSRCSRCGDGLADDAVAVRRQSRQVFDAPEPRVEVTEHRVLTCRRACGAETTALWPPEAAATSTCWGPTMRAMAVYLVVAQHLPYERAAQVLADLAGAAVSKGAVASWAGQTGAGLDVFEATVKGLLRSAGDSALR
jgi:transposase